MEKMTNQIVQLIPDLIYLETNVSEIKCFSFWDRKNKSDFFKFNPDSKLHFKYFLDNKIEITNDKPILSFSNIAYQGNTWVFNKKMYFFDFKFQIEEDGNVFRVNKPYQKVFIKIGWLEPTGYILTDYITYIIEKLGMSY